MQLLKIKIKTIKKSNAKYVGFKLKRLYLQVPYGQIALFEFFVINGSLFAINILSIIS
jgi:hypothetical protein